MEAMTVFFWGVGGSMALEALRASEMYRPGNDVHKCYKCIGFWAVRVLVAVAGGALSVAHEIESPLLAVHIGVATPILLRVLAHGYQEG